MARLSAARRKKLPAKAFAGPKRSFPIPDKNHARKALQMANRSKKVSYGAVKRKVCARYPGMPVCTKGGGK